MPVACQPGPVTATSPRASSLLSTPTSASAVRRPGTARAADSPWTSIERTRTSRPSGSSRTDSPTATPPLHVDPVTTVPAPATANTRSMGSRNRSAAGRSTRSTATRPRAPRSSSSPSPVSADTATARSQRQRREPQVDRDAATLLLLPAVGVDPGEGFHQGGLAVVDVPRGADYEAAEGIGVGVGGTHA